MSIIFLFTRIPTWAKWTQFTSTYQVLLYFVLMLTLHLRVNLPSGPLPLSVRPKCWTQFSCVSVSLACCMHHPSYRHYFIIVITQLSAKWLTQQLNDIHVIILYLHLGNLENVEDFLSINTSLDVCTISDTQNVQTMLPLRLQSSRTWRYLDWFVANVTEQLLASVFKYSSSITLKMDAVSSSLKSATNYQWTSRHIASDCEQQQ